MLAVGPIVASCVGAAAAESSSPPPQPVRALTVNAIHTIDHFAWYVPKRIHLSLVCDQRRTGDEPDAARTRSATSPHPRRRQSLRSKANARLEQPTPHGNREVRFGSSAVLRATQDRKLCVPISRWVCLCRRSDFAAVFSYRQGVLDHRHVSTNSRIVTLRRYDRHCVSPYER